MSVSRMQLLSTAAMTGNCEQLHTTQMKLLSSESIPCLDDQTMGADPPPYAAPFTVAAEALPALALSSLLPALLARMRLICALN